MFQGLERYQQQITSSFDGLYNPDRPLEQILTIPQGSEAPSFGEALQGYAESEKLKSTDIQRAAGMPTSDLTLLRIMRSSSDSKYKNGNLIGANYFFRIGLPLQLGERAVPGRIPIVFYDSLGRLRFPMSGSSRVNRAIKYLSEGGNTEEEYFWRRKYVASLLTERKRKIRMWDSTDIRRRAKMARVIKNALTQLYLTPVFLIPFLDKEELEAKRDLIEAHLENLSQPELCPISQ